MFYGCQSKWCQSIVQHPSRIRSRYHLELRIHKLLEGFVRPWKSPLYGGYPCSHAFI